MERPAGMSDDRLAAIYQRTVRVLRARPSAAQSARTAVARLDQGLSCEIETGEHRLRADLPAVEGGTGTGPGPGELMRSALAACLAIGYRLWAARLGVPVIAIEVEMTCELDARGQLGMGDEIPAGWHRIDYTVALTSDAPEPQLLQMVEHADRFSPMLANLDPGIRVERAIDIRRPQ
jgi:uncharacterized OsmC-like protein